MIDYVVASFSGGKDSTAMTLEMIRRGDPLDEVINVDTGMEFPEMYDHISRVKEVVEEAGVKFKVLKSDKSFEWYLLEKPYTSKQYGSTLGYGWPAMHTRWCTKHLKYELIDKYLNHLKETHNIVQCIGLASDEYKRLERPNNKLKHHKHPLVEWGWSEVDCLQYCYDLGYDWGGLYKLFNRVSCWCCPLASINELRKLWENYPELWGKLELWDSILQDQTGTHHCNREFKTGYNVKDLSRRFEREDRAKRSQTKLVEYFQVGVSS